MYLPVEVTIDTGSVSSLGDNAATQSQDGSANKEVEGEAQVDCCTFRSHLTSWSGVEGGREGGREDYTENMLQYYIITHHPAQTP